MVIGDALVEKVSISVSIDGIGIGVNVLNGGKMETMCRNPRTILKHYFQQEFPTGDMEKFEEVLSKYSNEDVERLADAVMRFGIAAILDAVSYEIK